jgi:hypothetical protein
MSINSKEGGSLEGMPIYMGGGGSSTGRQGDYAPLGQLSNEQNDVDFVGFSVAASLGLNKYTPTVDGRFKPKYPRTTDGD